MEVCRKDANKLEQPNTVCVNCNHCVEEDNRRVGTERYVCLSHTKYNVNPVTGKVRQTNRPVKCNNKNNGECSDYIHTEGDPPIGDPVLREIPNDPNL